MTKEECDKLVAKYACNFPKGSEEWQMDADFYNLVKMVWKADESEEYWDYMITMCEGFDGKYADRLPMARQLALGLINAMGCKVYGPSYRGSLKEQIIKELNAHEKYSM